MPESGQPGARPEVIVDFAVEDGVLFVTLANVGPTSAYGVAVRFDKPFHGLDGRKDVSAMRVFRRLEFLPPGKRFTQLVDNLGSYLRRREPVRLTALVTYRDRDGGRYRDEITHDLRIYKDLGAHDRRAPDS